MYTYSRICVVCSTKFTTADVPNANELQITPNSVIFYILRDDCEQTILYTCYVYVYTDHAYLLVRVVHTMNSY